MCYYIVMWIGLLFLLGLVFGSFAGAQVWRLRASQLREDKELKLDYDKAEYKRLIGLTGNKLSDDRSRCLSCRHELAWYDLLPLVSWLSTGGRCRYCRRQIGWFEPTIELGSGLLFAASYILWPVELSGWLGIAQFGLWLIISVMMVILFAYDAKWFLLPDKIVFPLIALSVVFAAIAAILSGDVSGVLLGALGAIGILSGIYYALWLISGGRWIGFGDVKLGIALGLLLANWQLAFLALFLANLIGLVVVLPGMVTKTLGKKSQIPFGPMLMLGMYLSFFFGQNIIDWYISTTMMLVV